VPQGWAVRWTGRVQAVDGRDWYEVLYNGERGWVSSRYVEEYVQPEGFPITEPGHVWVPLPGMYSFSFYVVVDVDAYRPRESDPIDFSEPTLIRWRWNNSNPDLHTFVHYGSLFSVEGVAMQGSGRLSLSGETVYFSLENPGEVMWMDESGSQVICTNSGFIRTGDRHTPARGLVQVMNPQDAVFSMGSRASELQSFTSLAGPPELYGSRVFAPDLANHTFTDESGSVRSLDEAFPGFTGEFEVEDRGGAFGQGERRFDLFIEDYEQGLNWYRAAGAERVSTEVFIQHEVGTDVP
jgi:hypothetical protein